jgi:hypothetical protein
MHTKYYLFLNMWRDFKIEEKEPYVDLLIKVFLIVFPMIYNTSGSINVKQFGLSPPNWLLNGIVSFKRSPQSDCDRPSCKSSG